MTQRIFIYGTLKKNMRNAGLMNYVRYLGEDTTREPIWRMHVIDHPEYPYPAITARGISNISGEVYEVDHATLRALDLFELAVPNTTDQEYFRQSITLENFKKAYAYIALPELVQNAPTCHDFIKEESNTLFWDERL